MKRRFSYITMPIMVLAVLWFNQREIIAQSPRGHISGTVIDTETKAVLPGANILIEGSIKGAAANLDGYFIIHDIPVGGYTLRVSYIGYKTLMKSDVRVKPGRTVQIQIELEPAVVESEGLEVTAGYFSEAEDTPTSSLTYSNEEIRRAPGSGGDVSRILFTLPSIAQIDDQNNSLIVRGGNPVENGFYVDGIEIPNINHFPILGSTGGSLSIINADLVDDVTFYAGGFPVHFTDKLSSIMDIRLREGNRNEFQAQLDLNFSGYGGVIEGPVKKGEGSYLFTARRSYLDHLTDLMDFGVTPIYGDMQLKFVYNIDTKHKISLIDVLGQDINHISKSESKNLEMTTYGSDEHLENTLGISWRALWSDKAYSKTSLSHIYTEYSRDFTEYTTDELLIDLQSKEQFVQLRNENLYRINNSHSIRFGGSFKFLSNNYNNIFGETRDALGNLVPSITVHRSVNAGDHSAFVNYSFRPTDRFETNFGFRGHYFGFSDDWAWMPRISSQYKLTDKTSLNASVGRFVQSLPLALLVQQRSFSELSQPECIHYILGIEHLFNESTLFSVEAYHKDYSGFPMDPDQPKLFILDEVIYHQLFFSGHTALVDNGKALTSGVETFFQKKLGRNLYGMITGSYFKTQYKDITGEWRNRVFDNRYQFALDGGYKPNDLWEMSARWIFAGGRPYTPFDIEQSRKLNHGVFDNSKINAVRYPEYHSLNIRMDRRFYFMESSVILYISIWNVYNRKNILSYYWNKIDEEVETQHQWSLLPIFGIEYEL